MVIYKQSCLHNSRSEGDFMYDAVIIGAGVTGAAAA